MSRPDQLTLTIILTDGFGRVHGKLSREVPEDAAYVGERQVGEFKMRCEVGAISMDDVVKVLKVREFRKGLLMAAARNMGALLAEHLEDKEGWHGIERQERLLEIEKLKGIPFQ